MQLLKYFQGDGIAVHPLDPRCYSYLHKFWFMELEIRIIYIINQVFVNLHKFGGCFVF
jgi:hypothetical protein